MPIGGDIDEIRLAVDGDGGCHGILLRVDHAYRTVAGVDDVNFVAGKADGDSGWIFANRELAVAPQVYRVEDGDSIASAVGDVGKFAIVGGILREVVVPASCRQHKRG